MSPYLRSGKSNVKSRIKLIILLISIITLSFNIQQVTSELKTIFMPVCISDPIGDWIGGLGNSYTDITSACILQVDEDTIQVEMMVVGNIPFSNPEFNHFLGFVWGLDLNENGVFGEFPPYVAEPIDANIRVAYDPDPTHGEVYGWHAFIDGRPQVGILSEFTIIKNKVVFSFPMSYIESPTSFRWEAGTPESTFEGVNLPSDLTLDPGLIRASWPPIPSILSCDSLGEPKDRFVPIEEVFVVGIGFPASIDVTTYFIPDGDDALPVNAVASVSAVTDVTGDLPLTLVWSPQLTIGEYDIWVDVNQNEEFDEGDVWNIKVFNICGFFVIPELQLGTLMGIVTCFIALATFRFKRLRTC
jgi:hypothetical protein